MAAEKLELGIAPCQGNQLLEMLVGMSTMEGVQGGDAGTI